jgi:hypothetical protein
VDRVSQLTRYDSIRDVGDELLGGKEPAPRFSLVAPQDVIVLGIQFDIVFLQVCIELIRPEHFSDFDQLVVVIMPVKEWFFSKDLQINVPNPNLSKTVFQLDTKRERQRKKKEKKKKQSRQTIDANMQPRLHMSRL